MPVFPQVNNKPDPPKTDGPTPPKPDGHWQPDPSHLPGEPWDVNKGAYPPFQEPGRVPGGNDTPGKGVEVVSVEAIKIFANNIESLLPTITTMIAEIDALRAKGVGPGNFGSAKNLGVKVVGPNNLVDQTRALYVEAQNVIKETVLVCRSMAATYKTAAELSELDAAEFKQKVTGVKSKIDGLSLGASA
jgi:hypothetical protein